MENRKSEEREGIAVALSGGGHRASLFGLGVLLYLADAEKNRETTSIASVSGGSITNAYVAQQQDFATATASEFRSTVAGPLARQIAERGTFLAAPLTRAYLAGLFLLLPLLTVLPPLCLDWSSTSSCLWVFSGVVLFFFLFWQRGNVCGRAYATTLFSAEGGPTPLAAMSGRAVQHVICATDLQTSRHAYFSGDFIYGYSLGWSGPGGVPLYKAVQASTAFPGGFPPTRIGGGDGLEFQTAEEEEGTVRHKLVLVDGGVYDNMADQWARNYERRRERLPALTRPAPATLIVVNSVGRTDWKSFAANVPLFGEVAAIVREMNVLYENTTRVRRQDLVRMFDGAERGEPGPKGAMVMIDQSPYDLADYFAGVSQEWPRRAARAAKVLDWLGPDGRDAWKSIANANAEVKTTLKALGAEASARLLRHAYVLAMCNLHVILDYPLHEIPDERSFADLVTGSGPASHA